MTSSARTESARPTTALARTRPATRIGRVRGAGLHIAAGLPVPGTVDLPADVERVELAEQEVAVTMHQGSMDGIGAAYQAIMTWVEAAGRSAAGGAREVSLTWEPGQPARCITELQIVLTP